MSADLCRVCDDIPEIACQHPAAYIAEWENGDKTRLCVGHAANVREHSDDLTLMRNLDGYIASPRREDAAPPVDDTRATAQQRTVPTTPEQP